MLQRKRKANPYVTPNSTPFKKIGKYLSPFSSRGSSARKLLFHGAQALASRNPYARAAMMAGKAAYGAGKYVLKRRRAATNKSVAVGSRRRSGFGGASTGTYKGRFNRPKKIKRTIESMALSKGYHKTIEQYGSISDPNCVYVTHSTNTPNILAELIAMTLMRKIMQKGGLKITNQYNEVAITDPLNGANAAENSIGLRFVYTIKNATNGDYINYLYDTTDNQNFINIATGFTDLAFRFIDYMRGVVLDEPYKLAVYTRDQSGALDHHWRLRAEMFLEDTHMTLFFQSNLVIQNRTKAALDAGTSMDADRIDSQPVKGWIYEFKNGDPRVRHTGPRALSLVTNTNTIFNQIPKDGVSLIRGGQYEGAEEPFVPKYFANVTKATRIILQPGEMKKTSFSYKMSGKLTNLVKKFRTNRWDAVQDTYSGVNGKCQMIALEELMRTSSDNKITLAYERELKIGCIVKNAFHQSPVESLVTAQEKSSLAP